MTSPSRDQLKRRHVKLNRRIAEIEAWSVNDLKSLGRWIHSETFEGKSGSVPDVDRAPRTTAFAVNVPDAWELKHVRLELQIEGTARLELRGDEGTYTLRQADRHHRSFTLPERASKAVLIGYPIHPDGRSDARKIWSARLLHYAPEVADLVQVLTMMIQVAEDEGGSQLGLSILEIAEDAVADLPWPSETGSYTRRIASLEGLPYLWDFSLPPDVQAPLQGRFSAAAARCASDIRHRLSELRLKYPPPGAVALVAYTHVDPEWLWPSDVSGALLDSKFATTLDQLSEFPELTAAQAGAALYAELERRNPDRFGELQSAVRDGRWEVVGGMWAEADTNLVGGEALIRQFLYGQRYFAGRLGKAARVGWLPDSFGFSGQLPQILAGVGIDAFFTTKLRINDTNAFPHSLFQWEGIDGTRILTHLSMGPEGYNGTTAPGLLRSTWQAHVETAYEILQPLGYSGSAGPTDADLTRIEDLHRLPGVPRVVFRTPERYFSAVRGVGDSGGDLPVWRGQLYLEAHRGSYTTQGRTKFAYRRAEHELQLAEIVEALQWIRNGIRSDDLAGDWKGLLEAGFHDIIGGTSLHVVHAAAVERLNGLASRARMRIERAAASILRSMPRGSDHGIFAINATLGPRKLCVVTDAPSPGAQEVGDGFVITSEDVVPPLAAKVIGSCRTSGVHVRGSSLENEFVKVGIDQSGLVSSVYDPVLDREFLSGPVEVRAYGDRPYYLDAWELDADYQKAPLEPLQTESVEVVERGPHRASVRVVRRFRDSLITQEIRLWSGSRRLDFFTRLDWHERRCILRMYCPSSIDTPHATIECPLGTVKYETRVTNSIRAAQFEVPGYRFADLSDGEAGLALLNNGRSGYQVDGRTLSLSLVRGPVFPDPLADEGLQAFTVAILPHTGDWFGGGVLAEATELNQPMFGAACQGVTPGTWTGIQMSAHRTALSALKVAEDGGGIVMRHFEPAGTTCTTIPTVAGGWWISGELDLLENYVGPPGYGFSPFQVRTWLLQSDDAREARRRL